MIARNLILTIHGKMFVEDIYLNAALTGPVIHIFDFHRKQEIVVKDFTSLSVSPPILHNFPPLLQLLTHRQHS
jgi:hypothetical protein